MAYAPRSSINPDEIRHFSKDSGQWWDENGPFAVLHRLQPARMTFIRDQVCGHFAQDGLSLKPFKGLSVLDIGCGGGLVSEPMARLGASVTGIDADKQAIEVAKAHAKKGGLSIHYINGAAEDLAPSSCDILLALEILEHIENPQGFIETCARLLKPGGLAIFSTLNRTPQSLIFGIGAAEYVLGWVPRGTHTWRQFITPAELAGFARQAELVPSATCGLVFDPLSGAFALSQTRLEINYFLAAARPPSQT